MILCLSARMFASPGARDQFELDIDAFIRFARSCNYDGITLRPGQIDSETPSADLDRIGELLKQNGLPCSFIKAGSVRDRESYDAHCKLIDHAVHIGCLNVQPKMNRAEEIPWIQKLCDYAAERDVQIAPQLHDNSLHDTVPKCLDLFENVDRQNFGLNFEASHLILQNAEIRNGEAVRAIGDKIFSVCIQNYKMVGGQMVACLPGDPDGVDFEDVFGALKKIGYDRFVTHISGRYPDLDNRTVCQAYVEKLRPLMSTA